MLITKRVNIKITKKNIDRYLSLGYNCTFGTLDIDIIDLEINSRKRISCMCDNCNIVNERKYADYNKCIKTGNYYCVKCSDINRKVTFNKKYGCDNPFQNNDIKKKIKEKNLLKYGVEHYRKTKEYNDRTTKLYFEKFKVMYCFQNKDWIYKYNNCESAIKKCKESKIKSGLLIADENLTEWKLYIRNCRRETNKYKKDIFTNWDGYDYYDKEYIKENFSLKHTNRLYPTIDHKISILNGFINKIPFEEISHIKNLCITKRYINSAKNSLNESEYVKK